LQTRRITVIIECVSTVTTVCLLLAGIASATAATINIGVFNSSQTASVGPSAATNPLVGYDSTANNAPNGLGGQREFLVRRTGGTGRIQLDIDYTTLDALSFTSSGNAVGRGLVTWDGPGTNVSPLLPSSSDPALARGEPDTFGLTGSGPTGGVDLTDGGTNNAITIEAAADNLGLPVYFHFYRSAGVYATATLAVAGSSEFKLQRYVILFSQFTAVGATAQEIFRDTKAITMQIDGRNASDATFDNLQASHVPEPSSCLLLASAGVAWGALKLRRR
jgi:hypothetical protein